MLAGFDFTKEDLRVADVEYQYWKRNLFDVVEMLLQRVGSKLELPSLLEPQEQEPIASLWQAAEYQRHLREFTKAGGNLDDDLLLPLVFFSGVLCYVYMGVCISMLIAVDETNLTRFNSTSDNAITYPLLVSLGLLPAKMRLHPAGYELLALLPHLLQRKHPTVSSDKKLADIKRELVWLAVGDALGQLDAKNLDDVGYVCVS